HRRHVAAAGTGAFRHGHLDREDLAQDAGDGVAVQLQVALLHVVPPVAPKRSVRMDSGGYPSSSRPAEAVSTKEVGPQMKMAAPRVTGQATSASIALSRRRAYPVQPGRRLRLRVC